MADLNYIDRDLEVKIVGQDATGNTVNYVSADVNGNLAVRDAADGPVTPGTVASFSTLIGGQFNTSLPTLTTAQQAALQIDSSGRVIVAPLTNSSVVKAQLQDNAGTAITLGQKVMASSVPVVIASDQSSVPVSMLDVSPANGTITAFDAVTTSLVGANGQVFYTGTPTANSAAVFNLSSVENVTIQANLLGGGGTLVVEVSMDGGTFWLRPNVFQISTQSYSNSFIAPFIATINVMGMTQVRVRAITSWAGTATIIVKESVNSRGVTIEDSLPAGANVIGAVTQSGAWTTGRTWTLASGTDSVSAVQSGTWNIGTLTTITNPVAVTQSGTWTVQQGTPPWTIQGDSASGASKAGNPVQIGGVFNTTQPTVTNGQTVEAQATARGALIVATGVDNFNINNISGTVSLPTGAATAANQSTEITSLQLIDNPVGPVAAGTAGTNSFLVGAVFNTTQPTLTNGQQAAMQMDSRGRILIVDSANIGTGTQGAVSVTTTATEVRVGASRLAGRTTVTAYNNGSATIFWGYTSGVTTTSGTPLVIGQVGSWKVGDGQSIYLIATSGTQNVRVTEV